MNRTLDKDNANIAPASAQAYAKALTILRGGGLVALPTETVYGLAADGSQDAAVAKIYALKGRPAHNPLIAHILSPDWAADLAEVNGLAQSLMDAFWPGPLTLVLPRKVLPRKVHAPKQSNTSALAGGWLPSIAIRCPDAPWAKAFLDAGWDKPLFVPSANLSGGISPTTAAHVATDFGDKLELIIDGGPCRGGIESTVLAITDNRCAVMLRPGTIPAVAFAPYIPDLRLPEKPTPEKQAQITSQIIAPGMLESHYAPRARVRLNASAAKTGELLLGFGDTQGDLNLSPNGDTREAARRLYDYLRRLDGKGVAVIAVAPIPNEGLGAAINDRLKRAAAER